MTAQDFAELVSDARQSGSGYVARCPCPHHEDRHRSLTFADGQTALVVKCHAGCTIEEICAALGVPVRDLFPPDTNGTGRPAAGRRAIVATYDYRDVDGRLLYPAVRFDPKGFAQRRPDGSGGWIWNLEGVPRVLYRLTELQGQADVVLVEGEKDADRLWALGRPATTNAMGAGKWQAAYAEQLEHAGVRAVVLIADNDRPGTAHMDTVGRSLCARGVAVRLLRLPDLPPVRDKHGEDVSDWLDAGHTGEELEAMLAAAPGFEPGEAGPSTDAARAAEPPRDGRPLEVIDLADLLTRELAPPLMSKRTESTAVDLTVLSVSDAEAAVVATQAEVARLRALAGGEISSWTTRREQRRVLTQTGRVEIVEVDVPQLETRQVGPLERLRARRALADAEDRLLLAEEQREQADQAAALRARAEQAAAITAGEAEVRRELPKLIRELQGVQQAMQVFAAKMEALDAPLGRRYLGEAVWTPLLPGQLLDFWITYVGEAFLRPGAD